MSALEWVQWGVLVSLILGVVVIGLGRVLARWLPTECEDDQ